MTAATAPDPDSVAVHPHPDGPPEPALNPSPDLTDPVVVASLLRTHGAGMQGESRAADPHGPGGGHANPAFFYGQVSRVMLAAAALIEKQTAKPAPVPAPPAPTDPVPTIPDPAKPTDKHDKKK